MSALVLGTEMAAVGSFTVTVVDQFARAVDGAAVTASPQAPPPLAVIDANNNIVINGTAIVFAQGTDFSYGDLVNGAGYTVAQADAIIQRYVNAGMNCVQSNWGNDAAPDSSGTLHSKFGIYFHGPCLRRFAGDPLKPDWRTDPSTWDLTAPNGVMSAEGPRTDVPGWWLDGEYDCFGTSLSGAVTSSATSITVAASDAGNPGKWNDGRVTWTPPFDVGIDTEILNVTAISGTTWTVTRGYKSTTAASHANGALVSLDVAMYTVAEAFIRTLDPLSRLQFTYLAVFGGGGTWPASFIPNNNQVPIIELVVSYGDPWIGLSKQYTYLNSMNVATLAASYPPGAGFCPSISTTITKELLAYTGPAGGAPATLAELQRFLWFQVAMNCRAFDVLWGPTTRDTTYIAPNNGDTAISSSVLTVRDTWYPSVLTDIVQTFKTPLLAAGLWQSATTGNPALALWGADTPNTLGSGVYAVVKSVASSRYVIALNINAIAAPQDTYLPGRHFVVGQTTGGSLAVGATYTFAYTRLAGTDGETATCDSPPSVTITSGNGTATLDISGQGRFQSGTTAIKFYGMKSGRDTDFLYIGQITSYSVFNVTSDTGWTVPAPITPQGTATVAASGTGLTGSYRAAYRYIVPQSSSGLSTPSAIQALTNQGLQVSALPTTWPALATKLEVHVYKQGTNTLTVTPSTSSGSLPAGTYYYMVQAVQNGSMLARTTEVSGTLSGTGQNALSWPAVTNATGYLIFRGTVAGRLYWLQAVTGTSFTDSSTVSHGTITSSASGPGWTPYQLAATLTTPAVSTTITTDVTNDLWYKMLTSDGPGDINANYTQYAGATSIETSLSGVTINIGGANINAATRVVYGSGSPTVSGTTITDNFTPEQVQVYQVT